MDAFDAQGLGLVDGVCGVVGPGARLLPLAMRGEELLQPGAGVGGVRRHDLWFRGGFGLGRRRFRAGSRCAEEGAGLGGLALGVGQGRRAGTHAAAADAFEHGEGLGGRVEGVGDLPQLVLPVEVDTLARVEVGAGGDGGVAVVGVGVDEEPSVPDVVVDLLGLVEASRISARVYQGMG
ncbi:hypothetical protein ABZ760_14850 [Streptomyces sp. NPDC006658]|uniref:hypothetical protein n=1 Tax=Streptomyces sp. NPDC006658 TaxID=3156900 RepID=UPI0034071A62